MPSLYDVFSQSGVYDIQKKQLGYNSTVPTAQKDVRLKMFSKPLVTTDKKCNVKSLVASLMETSKRIEVATNSVWKNFLTVAIIALVIHVLLPCLMECFENLMIFAILIKWILDIIRRAIVESYRTHMTQSIRGDTNDLITQWNQCVDSFYQIDIFMSDDQVESISSKLSNAMMFNTALILVYGLVNLAIWCYIYRSMKNEGSVLADSVS